MKKRPLLVIFGIVAAFLLLWPRITGYPRGSAPKVTLELGPTASNLITPGTALTFDIYLKGEEGSRLGSFVKAWPQFITLRLGDGTALPWRLLQGAEPYGMFFAPDDKMTINFDRRISSAADFDGSPGYYRVQFLLSPEESKRITPGSYTVVAVIEARRFPFLPASTLAESAPLSITFAMATTQNSDLNRIAGNAEFYIKTGQFSQALGASAELIAREPHQARSHIAQGDALAGLGKKREALEAYLEARRLLPRAYEPPLLLNRRIQAMESQ